MIQKRKNRQGFVTSSLLIGAAVCVIAGAAAVWFLFFGQPESSSLNLMLATVEKGDFVAKVLDQGEIQSSDNAEIRCEVRARNGQLTVISLVPEGARVEEGDFLIRLDSTAFEKELESQKISVANAKAAVIQSEANYETAKQTKTEYIEGTFESLQLNLENLILDAKGLIETSKAELAQAEAVYNHSLKLQAKGFITEQVLESDELAVERARLAVERNENQLKMAKKDFDVLTEFTLAKEKVQLNSNIEAAKVKLESDRDALRVQERQLAEIEAMIEKCEIVVPEGLSGQVVYAKERRGRGGDDWVLEEGADVRESQVLIRLPDANKMEVKALINEQNITQIETGMPASIRVDAISDKTLKGVVTKVNQYAESSGWGGSSVRKYAVKVRIFDPPEVLKPGMNASVFIQTMFKADALMVPIQSIYGVQEQQFCLVYDGEDYETREVKVGGNNSQMALILEGLQEGEQVVMNPGANKELMDLPEVKMDRKIEISDRSIEKFKEGESNEKRDNPKDRKDGSSQSKAQRGGFGGGGGGFGGGGPPSPETIVQFTMKRYDSDGNGKLSKEERQSIDSRFKSSIDKADTDGDGEVSKEELTKAMKSRMGSGGGGGR